MLQKLDILNFQRHKHLSIDLAPTVTVIVGPSDAGKSAIVRALEWLCFNRPAGEAFRRTGSKGTRVRLTLDDGRTITRRRGAANTYRLDSKEYKAFGSGVPPAVAELLNISDLNFQGQHDAAFWLALSPGQVSRELNQIIDLSIMDNVLANVASKLRRERAAVEVVQSRIQEAKAERKQLAWTRDAATALDEIERLESERDELDDKQTKLKRLSRQARQLRGETQRLSMAATAGEQLLDSEQRIAALKVKRQTLGHLTELALRGMRTIGKAPLIDKIANNLNKFDEQQARHKLLSELVESARAYPTLLKNTQRQLDEIQTELNSVKRCPACLRKVD